MLFCGVIPKAREGDSWMAWNKLSGHGSHGKERLLHASRAVT